MPESRIIRTDELRIYMGPKGGPIPRGAKVRLYAKVFIGWWRMGFFEWPIGSGEKWWAPIRCLWRCKD